MGWHVSSRATVPHLTRYLVQRRQFARCLTNAQYSSFAAGGRTAYLLLPGSVLDATPPFGSGAETVMGCHLSQWQHCTALNHKSPDGHDRLMNRTGRLMCTLCLLAATAVAGAQEHSTLADETANNTSASDTFRGMPNGNSPAGPVSKLPIRALLCAGATTKIYARLMPFFGEKGHKVDVGYDSAEPVQIHRQVLDMISRGIDGAIVDWYGPDRAHHHRVAMLLRDESEKHPGFEFAVSEDQGALKECKHGCDPTQLLISHLRYAYQHFERSPAYMRRGDRPVVMFFDVDTKYSIDWERVRDQIPGNPLFVFRNSGAFALPQSDGGYAWVGMPNEGRNGMPYLERFYKRYQEAREKKPVVVTGSAYKGFDDSEANWGKHRLVEQNCGQTWLDTFDVANHFFSSSKQLEALQIVTWNDYEEGTEIETGIDNCVSISASVDGNKLNWKIRGNERTIDHYTIWSSTDGQNLTRVANVPAGSHSLDLRRYPGLARRMSLYVEAIGKPSITNHISGAVRTSVRVEDEYQG